MPKDTGVNVSIDPGVTTLGIAVWNSRDYGREGGPCPRPIAAFAHEIRPSRPLTGSSVDAHIVRASDRLETILKRYRVNIVWCEKMEFRSNAMGIAAIEDVLNVQFACGVYAGRVREHNATFHPAPVSVWKGQLSKEQVTRRILKRWGIEDIDSEEATLEGMLTDPRKPSHDWDAVGIGLWGMGRFE